MPKKLSSALLTLLLSLKALQSCSFQAIVSSRSGFHSYSKLCRDQRQTSTALNVFERMSEDCVAAIITAQKQTNRLQLPAVNDATMLAGCVNNPESPALKRTFQQYSITWRGGLERALDDLYTSEEEQKQQGWLSGFRAAKDQEDRPFGTDLKQTLVQAGRLADQMASETISSHHVFLALLEYRETASEQTASEDTAAWKVLEKLSNFPRDTATAVEVCASLIQNLEDMENEKEMKELVTAGSAGSSKTPTLEECGVDLTQQARDGLLDPVYGRDSEIRSCLRTLMRRRKNNVCVIGEAGVGKFRQSKHDVLW